ncbi:unnamed protein product [Effrenium voratum]|nr:unnamed protein product [Effrenium voratum]
MCPAVVNAIFWHVGSLAFGSLILAIVQFLKWMMRFLAEQAKVRKNRVAQAIFRAAACCLWCFEKCLKFLNKNAYIQIALKGTDFCTSAQNAFALVLRNLIRFGGLAMLGSLMSFIGVVFMCSATGLSGYFIFQAFYPELSPIVPTILYVVIGYIIGRAFLNVFSLACDTSMQCFIISEEYVPPWGLRAFSFAVPDRGAGPQQRAKQVLLLSLRPCWSHVGARDSRKKWVCHGI